MSEITSTRGTPAERRAAPGIALAAAVLGLAACSAYPVTDVASINQNSRIDYIVIHFTSENFAESMRLLTQPSANPVSSHYLLPDPRDDTYGRRRPRVYRLVPEHRRAWHAGRSYWAGEESLNDRSVGIEVVNTSHCEADEPNAASIRPLGAQCAFVPFDDAQIELLIVLLRDILDRYPAIDPEDIVGHADIAPARKFDPGPLFPWRRLYDEGIGAWYDEETVATFRRSFSAAMPDTCSVRQALRAWGYDIGDAADAGGTGFQQAVRAFQMHFRPRRVTGTADPQTVSILYALLAKYRPNELAVAQPGCRDSEPASASP